MQILYLFCIASTDKLISLKFIRFNTETIPVNSLAVNPVNWSPNRWKIMSET